MQTLFVTGMTCGGCTKAVTRAIQMQDAEATVQVDLDSQKLEIDSRLSREALVTILSEAGFPVVD
jgi:copper chaperone